LIREREREREGGREKEREREGEEERGQANYGGYGIARDKRGEDPGSK